MIWFRFTEDRTDEDKTKMRTELKSLRVLHPIQQLFTKTAAPKPARPKAPEAKAKAVVSTGSLGNNTGYVPGWYKGEYNAWKSSSRAMSGVRSLPKSK